MNWLGELIQPFVTKNDSVLDVGCGIMNSVDGLKCKSYLGLDVWVKYLEKIKAKYNVIQLNFATDPQRLLDNSFDVVLALDVVEHLPPDNVWSAIYHLKRISRKRVIVFTPSKFETNDDSTHNAWNLGECPYQKHLSLVTKQQFEENSFKLIDNPDNALLAIWEKKP